MTRAAVIMSPDFEHAFTRLMGHEGDLSMDPNDPGNWTGGKVGKGALKGTRFGISAGAYPDEDIQGLTIERARELYRRDYWDKAGCEYVPMGIKFDLFDTAVNAGVGTAVRMLQGVVGEKQDGIMGPLTLKALRSFPPDKLVARFNGARLMHMTSLPAWATQGRGWARRVASNLMVV